MAQRYKSFDKINGKHPWRDVSADGYYDYPVVYRKDGRVIYFNFELARELGLISKSHQSKMNRQLEDAVLRTFSLRILNEHDWLNRKRFPRDGLEERLYMATRYLQLQHDCKRGSTSGDGRAIWNGYIKRGKKVFDVSSRGTGVTILSPGVQEARKPLKTGSNEQGYGSGLAETDEMLAGAVLSEIFYRQGFPTERTLAVIDYGDKTSVGVRCAPNLIRPAHLFRYLKSDQHKELKGSFDYFLKRQSVNGTWDLPKSGRRRYEKALNNLMKMYARLAALMEEEYIFNWLAWDGDNVLMDGSMLDYGSIRQFAAKHNKYRYDDVSRYSTNLTEQKREAKYLIQQFAQVIDFIISGEKKNIKEFDEHEILKQYEIEFLHQRQRRMLWRIGFLPDQIDDLIANHQNKVVAFRELLNYFEDVKTVKGETFVPDGIDHPPVFLVRHILREFPQFLLSNRTEGEWPIMSEDLFCKIMAASYVDQKDIELTRVKKDKAFEFQKCYQDLIFAVSRKRWKTLEQVSERAVVINYEYRSTGDGLTWIVNEAVEAVKSTNIDEFQEAIERFIQSQVLIPGKWKPIRPQELKGSSIKARLLRMMMENLELYSENI